MANSFRRGCVISSRTIWDDAISLEYHLNQNWWELVKKGPDMAMLPLRGWVIPLGIVWNDGVTFGGHLYPKCQELINKWARFGKFLHEDCVISLRTIRDENRSKNGLDMTMLPLRGRMIPLGTVWDNGVTFGCHLYLKWQELFKKWARYGHFNLGKLIDVIKDCLGHCCISRSLFWVFLDNYFPFRKENQMKNSGTLGGFGLMHTPTSNCKFFSVTVKFFR